MVHGKEDLLCYSEDVHARTQKLGQIRAKFARIWPKVAFARVAADTGERHNTNRALNGHHGHPVCGKGVVFPRTDLYFIFLEFLKPYPPFQPIEKGLFRTK